MPTLYESMMAVGVITLIILSLRGVFGGPFDFFIFIVALVVAGAVSNRLTTGRWLP